MAKIQVLDKHLAELIAAGEVVERPSSVIKELTENSIDAGATLITVEIRRGGVSYIRVSDNGHGIVKEDVPTAFLRHATSKIKSQDDLDAIASLGFRGEALASISAVSHVELVTKTAEDTLGTKIMIHGGDTEYIEDTGCPEGTSIIVRDIFYNVPARMKFLKKDVGEGNAVAAIMDKIALSHPEISIRFIRDGKEVLHTQGDGKLSSAIYSVYGREFLNGLTEIEYSLGGINIKGFISKPQSARSNRTMQNVFINGRYIKSRTAIAALDEAYKNTITVGKFPACVLHMEMGFGLLDVNVHPAKLDVRFINEKPIFDVIYHGVKTALSSKEDFKELKIAKAPVVVEPIIEHKQMVIETRKWEEKPSYKPIPKNEVQSTMPTYQSYTKNIDIKAYDTLNDSESQDVKQIQITTKLENIIENVIEPVPVIKEEKPPLEMAEEEAKEVAIFAEEEEFLEEKTLFSHKYIGEAFNTYIISEYKDDLMFIDKHAAHERLIYEKLKSKTDFYAQTLLSPMTVTLEKLSYDAIIDKLDEVNKSGFEIDDFGNGNVIVRSVPAELTDKDIENIIVEIAGYLVQNRNVVNNEYMDKIYHSVACKAAIKGRRKSTDEELIELAKQLEANNSVRHCPHGRPIYLLLKRNEIEKHFERT